MGVLETIGGMYSPPGLAVSVGGICYSRCNQGRFLQSGRLPTTPNSWVHASRLALPLTVPAGLIDLDRNRQRFVAAAISRAAHWRGAEIIETDGDAGVGVGGADRIRRVEPDPAEIGHVSFGPGVAGLLMRGAVRAHEMAGDEARRDAARARAGDEDMRVILTDATLEREGLDRRGSAVGRIDVERHVIVDLQHQRMQEAEHVGLR